MPSYPQTEYFLVSTPEPHILLITINRPKQYNALNSAANWELHRLLTWAEEESSIWCIIVTGVGGKSFCAGMDLVSAHETSSFNQQSQSSTFPDTGFGGLSNRRTSKKPVIAAVNGYALGGGLEMVVSCDIVVATQKSLFGYPEVKQGVVIAAGGLARLARSVSYQIASELVLTGRSMRAEEAKQHGLVNEIIPDDQDIVEAALEWARKITANSPDAVFLTKQGLILALERGSMTDATNEWMETPEAHDWRQGDNLAEGLKAFSEKRKPQWKNPVQKNKL
ncbi:ClpP/crotonase-like domain-containing protein [Pilobolus umbonatus]|nr:ClpP/crotonase-like domain-containing protein [Pilobolus umbonatus]